jgi:ribosome-binding protein aMBF1 (putative translation factor)
MFLQVSLKVLVFVVQERERERERERAGLTRQKLCDKIGRKEQSIMDLHTQWTGSNEIEINIFVVSE